MEELEELANITPIRAGTLVRNYVSAPMQTIRDNRRLFSTFLLCCGVANLILALGRRAFHPENSQSNHFTMAESRALIGLVSLALGATLRLTLPSPPLPVQPATQAPAIPAPLPVPAPLLPIEPMHEEEERENEAVPLISR